MKRQIKISASLMCADFFNLQHDVSILQKNKIDFLHIDIMDGHFVPNITIGFDVVNKISTFSGLPRELHLMMSRPNIFIEHVTIFPSDIIIFHIESSKKIDKLINLVKKMNCRVGIALNPSTLLNTALNILPKVDLLLIMTVTPGFSGQAFIDSMINKVREASRLGLKINQGIDIEVDGGLTKQRIRQLYKAGANVFVAGTSTIFKDRNLEENIQDLRSFTAKLGAEPGVEKN